MSMTSLARQCREASQQMLIAVRQQLLLKTLIWNISTSVTTWLRAKKRS